MFSKIKNQIIRLGSSKMLIQGLRLIFILGLMVALIFFYRAGKNSSESVKVEQKDNRTYEEIVRDNQRAMQAQFDLVNSFITEFQLNRYPEELFYREGNQYLKLNLGTLLKASDQSLQKVRLSIRQHGLFYKKINDYLPAVLP